MIDEDEEDRQTVRATEDILELLIFQGINQEREKENLEPVVLDSNISDVARAHSRDQARDDEKTTDPDKPCAYPIIRHQGLTTNGFDLGDRLRTDSVKFKVAGENIALISGFRKLSYLAAKRVVCPKFEFESEEIDKDLSELEQKTIIWESVDEAEELLEEVPEVEWVNIERLSPEEIAEKTVKGWMDSPGHRANVLNEKYERTGIGVVEVNGYYILTQNFVFD
ncbi:MAG: CAP domain-containing protein [Candidatus Colwellbacteria bacterium]|nr:CAP domain-containing protein [Candidatus Colwellbacteria bacterium]